MFSTRFQEKETRAMSSFSNGRALKVGIVDDSPLIRKILGQVIGGVPGMTVCAEAGDPFEARDMIKHHDPDVITLDIEMPRMNGIDFLEKLMKLRPMPVIMISTLTQSGADVTLRALEMGALDYVEKPIHHENFESALKYFEKTLVPKLRMLQGQGAKISSQNRRPARPNPSVHSPVRRRAASEGEFDLVGIACSTGGVERLKYLVEGIDVHIPPILIVQHINPFYVPNMAERMNNAAPGHISVKVAKNNELLQPDVIYFADNRYHLTVRGSGDRCAAVLVDAPPVNGFTASADMLFQSMASLRHTRMLGLVLSGMGNDGAAGLLEVRNAGGHTIGESAESCLVYGMPKAAAELGALENELPLERIQEYINTRAAL
jgi:two-component system, chemotaxis family, protein-glutamate methylesterase/glutaminase